VKQKRFNVEQIVAVLKQAEAGVPLVELIRRVGIVLGITFDYSSNTFQSRSTCNMHLPALLCNNTSSSTLIVNTLRPMTVSPERKR